MRLPRTGRFKRSSPPRALRVRELGSLAGGEAICALVGHDLGVASTAIVITGPPGAGKTSVLEKLSTLLEIEGVAFGALEVEQLGWGSPWLYGEPVLRQLEAVVALQRQAGRRLFLLAVTAESDTELGDVVRAAGVDAVMTVLLLASPAVIAERLNGREPDDWPGKSRLIDHARRLAMSMANLGQIDLRVDTEHRAPRDVARQLLDAARLNNAIPGG